MNLYRVVTADLSRLAEKGRIFGVVVGVVTNNQDPDKQARIKVKYPWLAANEESAWARLAVPMAGGSRGLFFLPEVGDEVLVAFEHGDTSRPYILGGLWGGVDGPPTGGDGRDLKVLQSKSGHVIRLDDTDGGEKIEIVDKTGKNRITVDAAHNTITISTDKDIELKAPQGKISIVAQEVEVSSSGKTKIEASADMTIKGAQVNIN